jgi:hypothetical protein
VPDPVCASHNLMVLWDRVWVCVVCVMVAAWCCARALGWTLWVKPWPVR